MTLNWRGLQLDIQTVAIDQHNQYCQHGPSRKASYIPFGWRLLYTPNPSEALVVGGNWGCTKYGLYLRWFIPAVKPFTPLADMFYEPRYGSLLRVTIYGEMNLLIEVSGYWRAAWSIILPSANN